MYVNSEPTTESSIDIDCLYFIQLFDGLARRKNYHRYFVLFKNNIGKNVFKTNKRPLSKQNGIGIYLHLNRDNYRNERKVLSDFQTHDCIVS